MVRISSEADNHDGWPVLAECPIVCQNREEGELFSLNELAGQTSRSRRHVSRKSGFRIVCVKSMSAASNSMDDIPSAVAM